MHRKPVAASNGLCRVVDLEEEISTRPCSRIGTCGRLKISVERKFIVGSSPTVATHKVCDRDDRNDRIAFADG